MGLSHHFGTPIFSMIAEGEKFAWKYNETRELRQLNRAQNLADKFEAQGFAAEQAKWEAYGNIASSVVTGMGNVAGAINTNQMQGQYDQYLSQVNAGQDVTWMNVGMGGMG